MKVKYKRHEMPEFIRAWCKKRYSTLSECAIENDIKEADLYNVVNGRQKPTPEILAMIGYEYHGEYRRVRK